MDHGHRRAKGLESLQIEPDGPQSASCRKNQIAGVTTAAALRVQFARHVVGVTAAAEEDSTFPGPQIQDRHLRGIKATIPCENREQYLPFRRAAIRAMRDRLRLARRQAA